MQRLQQQLEASQKVSMSSSTPVRTAGTSAGPKPVTPKPLPNQQLTSKPAKPAATTEKTKTQAGKKFIYFFYLAGKVQKKVKDTQTSAHKWNKR